MTEGAAAGTVRQITSLTNPRVKDIRALSMKKTRDETGQFLGEGLKLVTDALDEHWPVDTIAFALTVRELPHVAKAAATVRARGGEVLEVSEAVLAKITRRDNPQMVVGVFRQRLRALADVVVGAGEVWVALEQVRDPGNLGTIIRTVDSVGAKGVILVGETCDPFSFEAVRATMGSMFHVPLVRAGRDAFIAWARHSRVRLVGTHLKATDDYRQVASDQPTVLVMGNEHDGISELVLKNCDLACRLPQKGAISSLNVAQASTVFMYEWLRQNHG